MAESSISKAVSYWKEPECIPLLITLISSLLVTAATQTFESKLPRPEILPHKISKQQHHAEINLKRTHRAWKKEGKPLSPESTSRKNYVEAKSSLQNLRRKEQNRAYIQQNNLLMQLDHSNRSKIFSVLKHSSSNNTQKVTSLLHTPVGSYSGNDVLEGFAADAEYLGQSNEDK